MEQLMARDDGGRCFDVVALGQEMQSPHAQLSSLGSQSFVEPMGRRVAEAPDDMRHERRERGHVIWQPENEVPDVGGLGWRIKTGQLVKNQGYYSQHPKQNRWDNPTHAGTNSWQDWHGPKMHADADMMERLDRFDEEQIKIDSKKTFVNTTRIQTLDRFYNRKMVRGQLEAATSWAPHLRAKREVSSHHETFSSDLDEKPVKELKKVLTETVLARDRYAVRAITKRIQNEETWKLVWKRMEKERREDIRHDLEQRQAHTDTLMMMSGQPVRERPGRDLPANATQRTHELADPRLQALPKDVTSIVDFNGLIHVSNGHALESLYPGFGHELSEEFKARATQSAEAGWPAPPEAATPRPAVSKSGKTISRDTMVRSKSALVKPAIPAGESRLQNIGQRSNDELLKQHSKAQFLPTKAPPPPNQKDTLLKEDWTPATTTRDPARVTSDFARTHQHSPTYSTKGDVPPPMRSYVYPVLTPSSTREGTCIQPAARSLEETLSTRAPVSPKTRLGCATPSRSGHGSICRTPSSRPANSPSRGRGMSTGFGAGNWSPMERINSAPQLQTCSESSVSRRGANDGGACANLCQELDDFESKMEPLARISNFFGTPRATGSSTGWRPREEPANAGPRSMSRQPSPQR